MTHHYGSWSLKFINQAKRLHLSRSSCFRGLLHLAEQSIVALKDGSRIWVIRSQHFLSDGQCALVETFGSLILSLSFIETCQIIECLSSKRMVESEGLFSDCQSLLVERLSLLVPLLCLVDLCQIV